MENKLRYLVYVVAMLFLSPPLWALTDAEVEARLDQYAAKIKALEAELADAKKTPVYEQDVGKSSGKIEKQIQQIKDKMDSESERFKVNGFMTAAVAMADDDLGTDYNFDSNPNFNGDSKVGLQFNYKINDRADATVQLLARSRGKGAYGNAPDPWAVGAEWAYLGYQVTDDLKLRMGKLRLPFYMYSETLDVGYTYPWVRPPIDMYVTVLTSYNGADALYKFSTGPINHSLQFFTGSSANTSTTPSDMLLDADIKDMYGVNLTSSWGDWTARLMAATISIDGTMTVTRYDDQAWAALPFIGAAAGGTATCVADSGVAPGVVCNQWTLALSVDDKFNYYSAGVQYDNGSLFVIAEAATLNTLNGTIFNAADQGYVTGGYRFGSWTPYVTYGRTYDTESTVSAPQSHRSESLGLRKELGSSMSAKFEWNHFHDFENNGGFSSTATLGDDANIYTFALDAVF